MTTKSLQIMIFNEKIWSIVSSPSCLTFATSEFSAAVNLCACARPHAGMQKPLSNPFRPAASRNLKPSCEADEFARSAVSETNFHHAIKEADKGSGVVEWDRGDYISEANRQLDDRQVYEEVEVDPTVDLGKTINSRLNELREEDPGLEEMTDYLQVKDSRLGRFYLLPKIHKGRSSVKGRPVISNCGTVTEHISEYLDHHLNPLVSQSRSYVKDTNHFCLG